MPTKKKEKKPKLETPPKEKFEAPTKNLKPKQEAFCQHFTAGDEETFGNGTRAYLLAYGLDPENKTDYDTAKQCAYRLLTNVHILKRVNQLMNVVFSDEMADLELAWVAKQKTDLPSKVAAIREWNKVKGRITNKLQVKGTFSLTELLDAVDNDDKED